MEQHDATHDSALAYARDLGEFVQNVPSSFHTSAAIAQLLTKRGFVVLDERDRWSIESGGCYGVVRDGAVIAWTVPTGVDAAAGFRVIGAHTDSPGFKVKPAPEIFAHGWQQLGVEIYGGPVLTSWLDRELSIAGRVLTRDGAQHLVHTGPVARIPHLAIHLDRTLRDTTKLDLQRHTQPIVATALTESGTLVEHLAHIADCQPHDVVSWDLVLADAQAPRTFGLRDEFLAAGRLDNISSVFAALNALTANVDELLGVGHITVMAAFDHEEVGSASRSGAAGSLLEDVMSRVTQALGFTDSDRRRALAGSVLISADAGHGVHPNYPEAHDPVVRPHLSGGPMLKVNADQRYTSDAVSSALWHRWCDQAGVTGQVFVSHNTVPCGSTIGPLVETRLGMRSVDVGVPLLSMHSARELAHVKDLLALRDVLAAAITDTRPAG